LARPKSSTRFSSLRITIDWRYAIGQVLLTALGVALALIGSAWWADHQARVREQSELHNLLDAARVSERRLGQAVYEDSVALLIDNRVRDSLATIPDDSLVTLVGYATWWSDAQPTVAPFAALLANGDIHLVQDAKLRKLLPIYVGEIETRTQNVDALNQARVAFISSSHASSVPDHGAPLRVRAATLRSRGRIHEAMESLAFFNRNTVSHYRIMRHATAEMRMELERVLRERPVTMTAPRLQRDSFPP